MFSLSERFLKLKPQIQHLSLVISINQFSLTQLYSLSIMILYLYDLVSYISSDFILHRLFKTPVIWEGSAFSQRSNFASHPVEPAGI